MKAVIKQSIDTIADTIATKYASNPVQAAFIFDRIFLRQTRHDLAPERQFAIAEEDCGKEIGVQVRNIHQEYLGSSLEGKEELKNYAQTMFIAAFNKHQVNFLEHYTPNKTRGIIAVSFDANVGRINITVENTSEPEIQISGGASLSDSQQKQLQELAAMLRGYGGSVVFTENPMPQVSRPQIPRNPRTPQVPRNPCTSNVDEEVEKNRKLAQAQFKQDILNKYFGPEGRLTMAIGCAETSMLQDGILTLTYKAFKISGTNAAGQTVSACNINESRTINLNETLEERQTVSGLR